MIDELKLLRGSGYKVTDEIVINNPKLGEIADFGEMDYYTGVSLICSTPTDYKVFLNDKMNINWVELSDFDWFTFLYKMISPEVCKMLFGDFSFNNLKVLKNEDTSSLVLGDENGVPIVTEKIYLEMVEYLRKLHGLTRNFEKPANQVTHDYVLRRERQKLKRQQFRNDKQKSILSPLVSSLVNSNGFKYDYDTVWNLNIYAFMDALKRIQKITNYNQIMSGVYSGNVDIDKIKNKDNLNWIGAVE